MAESLYASPKVTMVVVNILFMLSGLLALTAGLVVYYVFDTTYREVLIDHQSLPLFYICTGGIILSLMPLSLFAMNNNRHSSKKLLMGAMEIIFIFHVAASVAAFTYQIELSLHLWNEVRLMFPKYNASYITNFNYWPQAMTDRIQRDFYCCGADDPKEWLTILNTTDTQGMPLSCCTFPVGSVYTATCTLDYGHRAGCGRQFGIYFADFFWGLGVAAAVLAAVQLTGAVCLILGLFTGAELSSYDRMLSTFFLALPKFIIFTGFFAYYTVYISTVAARKDEPKWWNMYLAAMFVLFLSLLSTCILSFTMFGVELRYIWDQLRANMKPDVYGVDPEAMIVMDNIQRDFNCCGATNSWEWTETLGTMDSKGVPLSCCDTYGVVHTIQCTIHNARYGSCGHRFGNFAEDNMKNMAYFSMILCIVQAFLLVLAVLAVKKKRQEWQQNNDEDMLTWGIKPPVQPACDVQK